MIVYQELWKPAAVFWRVFNILEIVSTSSACISHVNNVHTSLMYHASIYVCIYIVSIVYIIYILNSPEDLELLLLFRDILANRVRRL